MELHSAGENALILYLGDTASAEVSARVQAAAQAVEHVLGADLVDLVPSYASLLIIYDPLRTDHLAVSHKVRECVATLDAVAAGEGKLVVLPVYYDPEAGADLASLAENAGLGIEQVIALHSDCEYRVYAIGFAPGFAYLGEVDARIAAPRLATPRQKVPRGAVAIADRQTAVYPAVSPGGWNLIGRCPTRMFDPSAEPTMPVSVGDRVRFEPVSRARFLELGGEL
ncbi:5-oxoprolinase subunit PxpB [Pseudohalioglobus sediminis]|uniref:5-oxoprolinase subunit PxpB n=1 Tax=Pseudohalioglobus sediminis TaxID=2606449 RepID=A0A5B0X4K8_9GAMM|nr:5-oxoprolinase subunit PxpB [Pseudohalioglobus sediminis]KAA1194264.1 5-oxoprolinase subunit PxpB [Pseudohalioglobus sediminis]